MMDDNTAPQLSRRGLLRGGTALAMLPILGATQQATPKPLPQRKVLRVAWLPQATCVAPVLVAKTRGYFDRYNLDVELVGHDFHTEAFLQAPAKGEVDAAVTMLHNWLLPMSQGLPVKLITPVHGGCVRIVGSRKAGVTHIGDLKGQRLGVPGGKVSNLATMVYSIILLRNGLEPGEVEFVPVENEDFGKAFADGAITAAGGIDPPLLMLQDRLPDLVEIASNTSGPMAGTSCCVVGAGPSLWRDDRIASIAFAAALAEASDWTQKNPDEAAALFAQTSRVPQDAVRKAMTANNYHSHHIAGTPNGLKSDVTSYAAALKRIGMLPATLDPIQFAAEHVDQAICT